MLSLRELDNKNQYLTDKLGRCSINRHDYCDAFEFHLSKYRNQEIVFWEIGVDRGGSLRMWGNYFPRGQIVGIDIKNPIQESFPINCYQFMGDATSREDIDRLIEKYGVPDIVLDDGSHRASDITKSFQLIYPLVKSIYIIEDLGTQYEELWGDRFLDCEPFTDKLKSMSDTLAKNNEPKDKQTTDSITRICYELGQVYIYK